MSNESERGPLAGLSKPRVWDYKLRQLDHKIERAEQALNEPRSVATDEVQFQLLEAVRLLRGLVADALNSQSSGGSE